MRTTRFISTYVFSLSFCPVFLKVTTVAESLAVHQAIFVLALVCILGTSAVRVAGLTHALGAVRHVLVGAVHVLLLLVSLLWLPDYCALARPLNYVHPLLNPAADLRPVRGEVEGHGPKLQFRLYGGGCYCVFVVKI